jgi:hypothetical protein
LELVVVGDLCAILTLCGLYAYSCSLDELRLCTRE